MKGAGISASLRGMNRSGLLLFLLFFSLVYSRQLRSINIDASHEEKDVFVQKLLASLTLKEKIGQMTQV